MPSSVDLFSYSRVLGLLLFAVTFTAPSRPSHAAVSALPHGVALYAAGTIDFDSFSTISGGSVIAGREISHSGGTLNVESMFGGGGFTAQGAAFQNSTGPIVFNGTINQLGGPGSTFNGPVTSRQADIDFLDSSQTVNGNVLAQGYVELLFPFATINGNITAGGAVNVTAAVTGSTIAGAPIDLAPYVPPALPTGRDLSAGSNDINLSAFDDIALAPGIYGTLNYARGNTVSLYAGSYVFADIVSGFSLNELSFDTTAGPIDLYIAANDFQLGDLVQVVDGVPVTSANPSPLLSNHIFIETAGSISVGMDLYGTLFAPNGDVTLETFSDVTGRVLSGGNITLGATTVNFVPEPSSAVIVAIMAGIGGCLGQWHRQTSHILRLEVQ